MSENGLHPEQAAEDLADELQDAHLVARHERDAHEPLRADLERLAEHVAHQSGHTHAELAEIQAALALHLALPHTLHTAAEEGSAPLTQATEHLEQTAEHLEDLTADLSNSALKAPEDVAATLHELPAEVAEEVETVVQGPPPEEHERRREESRPRSRLLLGRRRR